MEYSKMIRQKYKMKITNTQKKLYTVQMNNIKKKKP